MILDLEYVLRDGAEGQPSPGRTNGRKRLSGPTESASEPSSDDASANELYAHPILFFAQRACTIRKITVILIYVPILGSSDNVSI
jgi:hypothetical protein